MATKHLTRAIVLALCALCVYSGSTECNTWVNSTSPLATTTLQINYPTSLPIGKINYYSSPSGNVEVNVTWCYDTSDTALASLVSSLTNGATGLILALTEGSAESSTSGAVRASVAGPVTMIAAILASLFLLPKSRFCLVVVCVIIALCAPTIMASTSSSVTVNVYVPSQITRICDNNNCFPYPIVSTPAPTSPPTSPPSSTTGSSPIGPTNPTDNPTNAPTNAPTDTPTDTPTQGPTTAPTTAPTSAPTDAPTIAPTSGPASLYFNLRVLILGGGASTILGANFATLAFTSVGMPFDYISVTNSVNLAAQLYASATVGAYSGIVSVYTNGVDPLSSAQNALIVAYQQKYQVKWAIVGVTDASGLYGVTMGNQISNEHFDVTLAPAFAKYGNYLNPAISANTQPVINWSGYSDTPCILNPITITNSTAVTPVLMAHPSAGSTVAAAVFHNDDGTQILRYFLTQGSDYIFSMAFSSVLVNWISPGGLFIGARRLTLSVQPDDLFLGSFVWNISTHSNPTNESSTWYRITADDLQTLADFFDELNPTLPTGSYLTVEWPTNFGGINNSYYTRNQQDYLYYKARDLMDKFYYLSHTWDHPCTFDVIDATSGYSTMKPEVDQNTAFAPNYFGPSHFHLYSNNSMITPCVTGLYNGGALQALYEDNIFACVSDLSVTSGVGFEPLTPYHGVYSTEEVNGFAGIYFVPRQALDIDYDCMNDAMVVDEYATMYPTANRDFEDIMQISMMYGLENKISFRHDPYMMHQTNVAKFEYDDPIAGAVRNISLVSLFIERVVKNVMQYYSLPIYQPQMDNLVKMFQQRQGMDLCGLTTTLALDTNHDIVSFTTSSTGTCTMTLSGGAVLSGPTVTMETYGVETTAYIALTAGTPQTFTLPSPIAQ